MDSSRIFIKGLPPSITEADFKKHFSSGGREVTDARLFANRRIGYVGYKTPEDAQSAVKYFNKTFVRMSRIGVEVARPIGESNPGRTGGRAPTAPRENHSMPTEAHKTNNDADKQTPEDDPKLKEYLEVMKPKSKKRTWENDEIPQVNNEAALSDDDQMAVDAGAAASDDEYEVVPRKAKRTKVDPSATEQQPAEATAEEAVISPTDNAEQPAPEDVAPQGPVSDADWARSRTSRLLGLLDDDEEEEENNRPKARAASVSSSDMEDVTPAKSGPAKVTTTTNAPAPTAAADESAQPETDAEPTGVRASMRLFVRNLPYDVQQEALQSEFASYGNVEEVSMTTHFHPPYFKMST